MQFDVDEMCQEKYRLVNEDGTPRDLEKPQVQELLENYKEYIKYKKEHFVGYQTNMGFDYEKVSLHNSNNQQNTYYIYVFTHTGFELFPELLCQQLR